MISYTCTLSIPERSRDIEARKVLSTLDRVIEWQQRMHLQQRFRRNGETWAAISPWE